MLVEKAFFKVSEVAEIIGLGRSKTYELIAAGIIPSIWLAGGRSRRVPAKFLEKWIEEQSKQADSGSGGTTSRGSAL